MNMGISNRTLISKIIAPLIWHELIDTLNMGNYRLKKADKREVSLFLLTFGNAATVVAVFLKNLNYFFC